MKRSLIAGLFAIVSLFASHRPVAAQVIPNEVVVKFKPGTAYTDQTYLLRRTLGLKTLRTGYQQAHIVVEVPKGSTQQALTDLLKSRSQIAIAEPNVVTQATAVVPNDLYYSAMQWNLQSVGGWGIRCDLAWTVSKGAGVPVAVLDTGCAFETSGPYYAAPDLNQANIIPLTDWVNGDIGPNDDNGHGTFLCTLIAARLNNKIAGAGVAPEVLLMPGKVLDEAARGRADWMVNGINEALSKGASIILLGAGTRVHSQLLQEAISRAVSRGVTVVMGAGNDGVDLDRNPGTWAVYSGAVMVGASTRDGSLAPYSNWGSAVRLIAPGGIPGTPVWSQTLALYDPMLPKYGFAANGNSFSWMIGTSVAAAHAAGVMALRQAVLGRHDIERGARSLLLAPGGVAREFLLVDAAGAVGVQEGSGGGSGGEWPSEIRDLGVTSLSGPPSGLTIGTLGAVHVTVRNYGEVEEAATVTLRDDTTGEFIGSQEVTLQPDQSLPVSFNWVATAPVGAHTLVAEVVSDGDLDLLNNSRSGTVQVLAQPFAVQIASYHPEAGNQSQGVPQDSFLGGQVIGLEFRVTDDNAPAIGASVSFRVIGATGATVMESTATTDAGGRATAVLMYYYTSGGPGTYRVEATASKGGKTAFQTYTFQVTSPRGGR